MRTLLEDLDHHRSVLWPSGEGWEVDFIQAPRAGHDVGMEFLNYIDTQVTKVILGSTLMQQPGERGSFALGAVHTQNVFGSIAEADSLALCDTLEHNWCKWLFEINNIPLELRPKVVQASGKSVEINQVVDMMLLLAEKGYPVSVEQVAESTGIRPARDGETLLKVNPMGGMEGIDLIHGQGSPFQEAKRPEGLLKISDTTPGKMPKQGHSLAKDREITKKGVRNLDVDLIPEKSYTTEDIVERHRRKDPQLYRQATSSDIPRVVGPIKAKRIGRFASNKFTLTFNYVNLNGEDKWYEVEPYAYRYRRGYVYLYGFDKGDGRIKSFFAHKLRNVDMGRRFRPRWIVEIS